MLLFKQWEHFPEKGIEIKRKRREYFMEKELKSISTYEGSTLLGMNGGQPESPDGQLLV